MAQAGAWDRIDYERFAAECRAGELPASDIDALLAMLRAVVPERTREHGTYNQVSRAEPSEIKDVTLKYAAYWLSLLEALTDAGIGTPEDIVAELSKRAHDFLSAAEGADERAAGEADAPRSVALRAADEGSREWNAARVADLGVAIRAALAMIRAPGPYRVGKKVAERHFLEGIAIGLDLGRLAERLDWQLDHEAAALREYRAQRDRVRGGEKSRTITKAQDYEIIRLFDEAVAAGEPRRNIVARIVAKLFPDLEGDAKRKTLVRSRLTRVHAAAWEAAEKTHA